MKFKSQQSAIDELEVLVESDRHSILISGPSGCGKSYLSNQFAQMKNISDFVIVKPSVSDIREAVESCIGLDNKVVVCIENLDLGVVGASYSLLKFLEEPSDNVYIIVTCRNINRVPDTIISRSSCVVVGHPRFDDLDLYAKTVYSSRYIAIKQSKLHKCLHTLSDVDTLCKLSDSQIAYFNQIDRWMEKGFRDAVSNTVWNLGHFEDNTETPIELVVKYIMTYTNSKTVRMACVSCLNELSKPRIAKHTILTRMIFECKYVAG